MFTPVAVFAISPINIELPKKTEKYFDVYLLEGALVNTKTYRVASTENSLWVGTSRGLLEFRKNSETWWLWTKALGLPGDIISDVIGTDRGVVIEIMEKSGEGSLRRIGPYLLDHKKGVLKKLPSRYKAISWDGDLLWVLHSKGIYSIDLSENEFTKTNIINMPDNFVGKGMSDIHATPNLIWITRRGKYVSESKSFEGGGLARFNKNEETWKVYEPAHDGISHGYSNSIASNDDSLFVAHWHEDKGLSKLDLNSNNWSHIGVSNEGHETGGVRLHLDNEFLWVGQQEGLVKVNTQTNSTILYREKDGLPGYIISGINSGEDAVWAAAFAYKSGGIASSGIIRVRKSQYDNSQILVISVTLIVILTAFFLLVKMRRQKKNKLSAE